MKILVIGLDSADPEILFGEERLENLRRLMEYGCFGRLARMDGIDKNDAWLTLLTSQPEKNLPVSVGTFSLNNLSPYPIEDQYVWSSIAMQDKPVIILVGDEVSHQEGDRISDMVYSANRGLFQRVGESIRVGEWDFLMLIDRGLETLYQAIHNGKVGMVDIREYYFHLDGQIGSIFELLNDETLVLVISPCGVSSQGLVDGSFILASSNNPLMGEISGVDLIEIAPTLLELGGYEIPDTMLGVSLVAGKAMDLLNSGDLSADEEAILRERLSGLGYIS